MPVAHAKAEGILSVVATDNQTARVQFRDAANQIYSVEFPQRLLGGLVTALIATASRLDPSGPPQTMHLTSGRVYYISEQLAGLELILEGSLRVPLTFPKEGIEALRKSLDELERRPTLEKPA